MVKLTNESIDYGPLAEAVRRPECGGVVLFLGTVRDLTEGRETVALDYEAYAEMAEKKMAEIEAEIRRSWPVGDMIMVHRLGRLQISDISVAVAVSCPHRGEAFAACRQAIDLLKATVPIWKRENWSDGSTQWVHPGEDKVLEAQEIHDESARR
jgi:molybdopterin synthase catalytic subunit